MPYSRADRGIVLRSLRRSQRGRCAVCRRRGSVVRGGGLVLDHCHRTGRPRAILCTGCNTALGMAGENPTVLESLAVYAKACQLHAASHGGVDPLRQAAEPISLYVEGLLTQEQRSAVYARVLLDPTLCGRF